MEKLRERFGSPTAVALLPRVVGAALDALDGSVARLGDLLRARLAADRA
jgi:hypothetical protein